MGTGGPVQIIVSDGKWTSALPSFAITVAAAESRPFTRSHQRDDILATTDTEHGRLAREPLSGYRIYYGTASQQYTATISVSNPGLTTYVIDALDIGTTYYFAVTAVTPAGVESAFSPEIAATIS